MNKSTPAKYQKPFKNLQIYLRSFRTAAWLGWQIESNWADPLLFAGYSIIKPLAGAAILVVMYGVITGGDFQDPLFTYMYLGNAFYIYVGQILNGVAWAVVDDREHYKTLKYIYTAPVHYPTYLVGRAVANFLIGSIAVVVTLVIGVLFLHVEFDPLLANWPLFLVTLAVGVIMLGFMGLILGGFMLVLAHHMWDLGIAVSGALFLFSGAVFPLEILPPFLRWIGYLVPVSYWLELIRRALVGEVAEAYPTFANLSNAQLMGILLGLTILFGAIAAFSFRRLEFMARERGSLDRTTNY